ncbi:flagellar hook-associated protein FlgL [Pseudomaricurvus sp.]|uniref:flagellar hook-associated protein FlgL n=1 Tax=Pseudomaricurvus sp. TaxID=2004510 RepID=UPI003F6AE942
MRISTLQIFNIANNSIRESSVSIAKTQEQLSSGKNILTAADDPVGAAKILQLEHNLSRIDQYGKNIDLAENNLSLEETTLDSVSNLIQRVRELAVKAGNTATYTPEDYANISSEVGARLDELKDLMNTQNSSGDYIFAGYKGGEQPFVGNAMSGFEFHGSEGGLKIKVSESTAIMAGDSGKDVFWNIPAAENSMRTSVSSANTADPAAKINVGQVVDQEAYDAFYPEDMIITYDQGTNSVSFTERSTGLPVTDPVSGLPMTGIPYAPGTDIEVHGISVSLSGQPDDGDQFFVDSTPNQDILTTLSRFNEAMKNYDGSEDSKTELSAIVGNTLDNLDNTQAVMAKTTANLGARFNTLDSMREQHLDTQLYTEEVLGEIQSLDYAEAATRLAGQSLILDAAQASFMKVSQLTLFSRM